MLDRCVSCSSTRVKRKQYREEIQRDEAKNRKCLKVPLVLSTSGYAFPSSGFFSSFSLTCSRLRILRFQRRLDKLQFDKTDLSGCFDYVPVKINMVSTKASSLAVFNSRMKNLK